MAGLAVVGVLVVGCGGPDVMSGTGGGGDCTSHYVPVADAPTRAALLRELREDVDRRVRDLRVIDDHSRPGKVVVNLLNARGRNVMSLDMWQRADGSWTARQWSQCIDS